MSLILFLKKREADLYSSSVNNRIKIDRPKRNKVHRRNDESTKADFLFFQKPLVSNPHFPLLSTYSKLKKLGGTVGTAAGEVFFLSIC